MSGVDEGEERKAIKGQRGRKGGGRKDECILHLVAPGQRCEKGRGGGGGGGGGDVRRRDMNALSISKGAHAPTFGRNTCRVLSFMCC